MSELNNGQDLSEMSLISLTERLTHSGELARARVIIPNDEELQVTLVDLNAVRKLDELRSDEGFLQNCFFTMLGALIGSLIDFVTDDNPVFVLNKSKIIVIVVLFIFSAFLSFLRWKVSKRAEIIKKKILRDE